MLRTSKLTNVIHMPPADDALLKLSERLATLVLELSKARDWVFQTAGPFDAAVWQAHRWPEDFRETLLRVGCETELGQSYVRACRATEAIYEQLLPLCRRIRSFRPRTTNGRAMRKWAGAILQQHGG